MQAKQVLEIFALRSDASEIPVDVSLSLLTIGSETFAISATRDATERRRIEELKRAEAVLRETRESEQRFRLIADTAPVLIWMSGADQLCIYFNKPWLDFTGRSIDSELGNGWAEGVHPEDLRRCMDTYTHAFDRREEFRMEYRLRRHDGEYRWVLDIGVPRSDQDRSFVGYIGIGVDITERKQAEERLREYERVIQGLEERIMVVDREYRYVIANRAFLQYRSMEREQVVGHFVPEVVGKEVFETVIKGKMDECFKGKVVQYELKYRYTNLGERDLFVSYFPIEGPTASIESLLSCGMSRSESGRKTQSGKAKSGIAGSLRPQTKESGSSIRNFTLAM
jgi:PAS domain S-box-containing protein